MSSKLIKFGQPNQAYLALPYPAARIKAHIVIMVLDNGTVELLGHVVDQQLAQALIAKARERLDQWHAQQQALKRGVIVGADGLPASPNGEVTS